MPELEADPQCACGHLLSLHRAGAECHGKIMAGRWFCPCGSFREPQPKLDKDTEKVVDSEEATKEEVKHYGRSEGSS